MHSSLKRALETLHLLISFLNRCFRIFATHAANKSFQPDLAVVDFETGGLNAREHEILEIGVVRVDPLTHKEVSRLSIKIKPTKPVPAEAAKINGYNEKDWADAKPLREGLEALFSMVKGTRWVGSKPSFDWDFAVAGAEKEGLPLPKLASHRKVDISGMAEPLVAIGLIDGAGVDNLIQFFKLPFERGVHRAIVDAEATLAIYQCLLKIYEPATILAFVTKMISESEELRSTIIEALIKAVPASARNEAL
jgi:DNA polymerase III epsilon subunit-like protein